MLDSAGLKYRVVTDPNRPELGLFLRAAQPLHAGELALEELPLLRVSGKQGDLSAFAVTLRAARLWVPGAPEDDDAFTRKALHFNSFAAGPFGRDQVIFPILSRANHSCRPNCLVDGDLGTMRALSAVEVGEELTVSYLADEKLLQSCAHRRAELKQRWSFHCCCRRCEEVFDDLRHFRFFRCASSLCSGSLAALTEEPSELRCPCCEGVADEKLRAEVLRAEAAAAASLQAALSGQLEEEEEGAELMRCHRFAERNPQHEVSIQLACEFAFPDPIVAKQRVLAAMSDLLGPGQLSVAIGRDLARLLAERGDAAAAQDSLEAAAAAASLLDGVSSAEVLKSWETKLPVKFSAIAAAPDVAAPMEKPLLRAFDRPPLLLLLLPLLSLGC